MLKKTLRFGSLAAALFASSIFPALAQSQSDIAAQVSGAIPDNGRGQITAAGLRGVLNAMNGARGANNGIATLGPDGSVPLAQTPGRMLTIGNDLTANGDAGIASIIPFGNTAAKHYQFSRRVGTQASLLGTTAIVRNTPGSGTFGPSAADYAILSSLTKDNWDTASGSAALEGEIDTQYILARQGKKGDAAALLIDVAKRRDTLGTVAADESGGLLGYEIGARLTNASGQTYHEIHSYAPFYESPIGISSGAGFGNLTTAFMGTAYSAYGASVISGSNAAWSHFAILDTTGARDGSGIILDLDGLGQIKQGLPSARVSLGYRTANDNWAVRDQNDNVLLSVGRTSAVTTSGGGFQIGSGSIEVYRKATSGSATIPSLTSLNSATIATVTLAGAAVGDLVTASITSPDPGFNAFRIFGVVTAANTVDVRVQNASGATAGGFAASYAVKAERFTQ